VSLEDEEGVTGIADHAAIVQADGRAVIDGHDVTAEIRTPAIDKAAAAVARLPRVRESLVREFRKLGAGGAVVMEGRDIGTVVFPEADLKIFMSASLDERTRRRLRELEAQGIHKDFDTLRREIEVRDEKDAKRDVAPLRPAEDAVLIDTTNVTIEQQVDFIVQALEKRAQEA
jgi:cytidylate kinase